ncbi:hypothetical protein V5N11_013513 [Cardamine amara subsp. amara]|uniref:DNA-directed RNA polymerase n=1 Tax=Cardamine amara subsp. amara TaxID=228776 RepID=A0ABD1BE99_CARAN
MEAGHILLGRPWQSDRRVLHDGFTNRHRFEFKGRKTTLVPFPPNKVYLDQIRLMGNQKQGKKAILFAMARKTIYDDPFDPKLFVDSSKINLPLTLHRCYRVISKLCRLCLKK